jgi:uncharacterized delta-60 repeat protein
MRGPLVAIVVSLGALVVSATPAAAERSGGPVRLWSVSTVRQGGGAARTANGAQSGGSLHKVVDLGRSAFNFGATKNEPDPKYTSPVDGRASGEVFSSADGARYSVAAQSPILDRQRAGSAKGGVTHLDEFQAYEKRSGDASLRITITDALIEAIDDSLGKDSQCRQASRCFPLHSIVRFRARAYAASAGGDFFDVGGVAFVTGHFGAWEQRVATFADSRRPLWTDDEFTSVTFCADSICATPDAGAYTALNHPRTLRVPLRSVGTGELFGVHVSLDAEAVDERGVESAALAYLRDPQERGPALLRPRGLVKRGRPRFKEPRVKLPAPARCPGHRHPHAGVLQLSAANFTARESERAPLVLVTRTGGSRGQASVSLTAHGGSARARRDFKPTTTTVRFAAGERSPRLVEIPLREDGEIEPDETFTVTLGHNRCAKLGKLLKAGVTIVDDDQVAPPPPPPAAFTVGGTVDGLAGSGLVLSNLGQALPVSANGSFTLPGTHTTGEPYDVRVSAQPRNPDQLCSVQNGAGHVGAANVTGIAVHCATVALADGLDTTFGSGGRVSTPGSGEGRAVLIQPDGHIVTVGPREVGTQFHFQFGATRHDEAGKLDPSFGTDGISSTSLGGNDDKAYDAALLADGGFVAVGQADPAGLTNTDFGLVRYTPDGHPDPAFDGDGIETSDLTGRNDGANAVAVQPDGKIVVAGFAETTPFRFDFALARYNPDGTLDHGFGGDGVVTTDLGTRNDSATGLALQRDGKIVVVGSSLDQGTFLLARYLPDGTLDTTFGASGKVISTIATATSGGVVVTPGGAILVAGSRGGPNDLDVIVAGFAPNGDLNLGFGEGGVAQADLSDGGLDLGNDLVLEPGGDIVVVGRAASETVSDMALARFKPDGTFDRSLKADFRGFGDTGYALAIDAKGRIVAAGSGAGEFALMRAFL